VTLPQLWIDTTYTAPTGQTITVNAGGNLQAAINSAPLGSTIVLQAGATFNGPFSLPNKTGTGWIYVRTSAYSTLPTPGNRVAPSDASKMPTILGTGSPVIALSTQPGAHHFRFVGIRFTPRAGTFATNLLRIGDGERSLAALPTDMTFDRCLMESEPNLGGRRAIGMNGIRIAIVDSHLSGWREEGADSQAIISYNSPGPLKIVNNYLEGAGENFMIGGADALISGMVPSDVEFKGNYVFKPLSWRGQKWSVKNLFELKNGQRLLVEGNIFENSWPADQDFAINIKSTNQDGGAPWSVTKDLTFRNNIIRHVSNGWKACGVRCDGLPTGEGGRYHFYNNLWEDVGAFGGEGKFFQTTSQVPTTIVENNTVHNTSYIFSGGDGGSSAGFIFSNNVVKRGTSGFKGSGTTEGLGTLNAYFPGWTFTGNAIVGGASVQSSYPPGNTFPLNYPTTGGADMAAINEATKCAQTGKCK